MIFLGNGDDSRNQVNAIKKRLDEAFNILSGIQQGPVSTSPKGSHDRHLTEMEKGRYEIKKIYKEIGVALGVKKN